MIQIYIYILDILGLGACSGSQVFFSSIVVYTDEHRKCLLTDWLTKREREELKSIRL